MKEDDSVKEAERERLIEDLAEDFMYKVQAEMAIAIRSAQYNGFSHKITRADIHGMCSGDEFNDLFYSIAERLIKISEK